MTIEAFTLSVAHVGRITQEIFLQEVEIVSASLEVMVFIPVEGRWAP